MTEENKKIEEYTLKKGAVGLWHGVFQSFSFVAPAGDVAILLVGTVAFAEQYTAISVLLAWLIYGLFMITPYEFSKIKANAGIIVEPIAGEGGYIVPPKGFLKGLREIASEHNVLLIVDEIQTGVGRTGKIWAYEWEGIKPDIITISKGIGEGIPISLVAYNKDLDNLPQAFHLGTYRGNPIGMAVGNATLNYLMTSNILERVVTLGDYTKKQFNQIMEDSYKLGKYEVRGLGFMIGIEFSNENKSPISVKPYIDMLLRNGVIMYKAGMFDNVLRYMAPLTIPKLLIDRGLEKFEDVIKSTK
ncbi:hypothetical protein DJ521_06600 [Sulfolobus sp. E3]|nr:hypothetical protein DJ521_06600 [Sulfolobus sp. E3]